MLTSYVSGCGLQYGCWHFGEPERRVSGSRTCDPVTGGQPAEGSTTMDLGSTISCYPASNSRLVHIGLCPPMRRTDWRTSGKARCNSAHSCAGATDPQRQTEAVEMVKTGLRDFDVLPSLAKIACSVEEYNDRCEAVQLAVMPPVTRCIAMHAIVQVLCRSLWFVHRALAGLENCSFACPACEAALISMKLLDQSHQGFITGLVRERQK